jgi:integrase
MRAHKMNDGRWCVWLDLGVDMASGRRLRKRVEAKTKRGAESKATALRERHQRGEDINLKPRTLGELLDEYIATKALEGYTENTISAYRRASKNQIKPYLGAIMLPKLHTSTIQIVVNDLARRLSPSYLRLIKTVLVQSLNYAIGQHPPEITINPAKPVRIPKVKIKPGRSLTPDEVHAVFAVCDGHRYGLAVRLALMGLRRGELPGLRWEDFDEQAGTLMVRRQVQRVKKQWVAIEPKDDSVRMLSLGPKMTTALRQYRWRMADERDAMGWENSGYIFVSTRTGGICPPPAIYEAWRGIARAAGIIPTPRLHDCRHTAATTLIADGADIASVSGVLGHASPQVTLTTYAHALPHKVADASRRLEDIYE